MHTDLQEKESSQLLQKAPIFAHLSFSETAALVRISVHQSAETGEVIIEHNTLGEALYVLIDGEVSVSRGPAGQEEEIGRLGVGELFGEMSLVDDLLTSARVTATKPTRLLKIPRPDFQGLMEEDPSLSLKVYRAFCTTLSKRLRRVNDLLSSQQAFEIGIR